MRYNIDESKITEQYDYMERVRLLNSDSDTEASPKYAYIQTFGCQQNEADSECISGMLEEMGYTICENPQIADVIIVNTCAVREHAELKALSITGEFKHLKAAKKSLLIGICGCMVSQEHRMNDIKNKYPYVDFLFGTENLYKFPEILYGVIKTGSRSFNLDSHKNGEMSICGNIAEGLPVRRGSRFKAWVSIMFGCDNFCTYCVVPYVRGRERSRARMDILREIEILVHSGYHEITLLGQNVNSYGRDLTSDERVHYDFADLLSDICRIDGDFIVRFMTSHPKDATHKLIDVMADNAKIAKQFHLPLQSGSNRVLDAMNRKYTRESYLELVEYMRTKMPDIALSTDIIVGFPTETDDEFEDTLDMLKTIRYDSIYSFIYSKRSGTAAAAMDGQIPNNIKGERFERMTNLQNEISYEKNQLYVGMTIKALVECRSKTDASRLTGRNEKNRLVHFESSDDSLIGHEVYITVTKAETYALYGEFAGLC